MGGFVFEVAFDRRRGVDQPDVAACVTPVVVVYMLLDWDKMIATIDGLVPLRHRETARALAREIDAALAGFLRGQSLVCLFLGIGTALDFR